MITKIIWEESDIIVGRWYYRCADKYNPANISYYRSTAHMIGYISHLSGDGRYVWISMSDGMVSHPMSKKEYATMLTEYNYVPIPDDVLREIINA